MNVRRLVIGLGGLVWFWGLLVAAVAPGGWLRLTPVTVIHAETWIEPINRFFNFGANAYLAPHAILAALAGALICVIGWSVRTPQDREF